MKLMHQIRRKTKAYQALQENYILCIHALCFSLPMFFININYALHHIFDEKDSVIDVGKIQDLKETPSYCFGILLSLINLMAIIHHINEKETDVIISLFVSIPFTLITITSRLICFSIILSKSIYMTLTAILTIAALNILIEFHLFSNYIKHTNHATLSNYFCCFPSSKLQDDIIFYGR